MSGCDGIRWNVAWLGGGAGGRNMAGGGGAVADVGGSGYRVGDWHVEYHGDAVTGLVVDGKRIIGDGKPMDDPMANLHALIGEALELVNQVILAEPPPQNAIPLVEGLTVGQLGRLLRAQPNQDAPLLVCFDARAGIARPAALVHNMPDPPDWADPSTVYLDTEGG